MFTLKEGGTTNVYFKNKCPLQKEKKRNVLSHMIGPTLLQIETSFFPVASEYGWTGAPLLSMQLFCSKPIIS